MPDNQNNGNNIVDGFKNTSDSNLQLNLFDTLVNLTDAVNNLNKNVNNLDRSTKDVNKSNAELRKSLAGKDANSLKSSIDKLKENYKKSGNNNADLKNLDKLYTELQSLTSKTESMKNNDNISNKEKDKELKKLNAKEEKLRKAIISENNRLMRQQEKARKVEATRSWKLAEHIEDAFGEDIRDLGKNLTKTFREGTSNNIKAMGTSVSASIIGFLERSILSAIDYQTDQFVKSIDVLHSTFESTGTSITRAILLDRNKLIEEWKETTDRLKSEGYDKALSIKDIAQLEEQMAKAGITNQKLISEVAFQVAKTSAETGIGAPEFLSTEALRSIQSIYDKMIEEGVQDPLKQIGDYLYESGSYLQNAINKSGSALAFSEGKAQELYESSLRAANIQGITTGNIENQLKQSATMMQNKISAQAVMGKTSGGTNILNTLIAPLDELMNKGVIDGEVTEVPLALQGIATKEDLQEYIKTGNYLKVLTNSLEQIGDIVGGEATTAQAKLLQDVFGINPTDYGQLLSTTGGNTTELINRINKMQANVALGSEGPGAARNQALVKSGRHITKEQNIANKAVNDAVAAWGLAEESPIPYATEILKDSITTGVSALEYAITGGIKTIYNALVGSTGASLLGGAGGVGLTGIAKALGVTGVATGVGLLIKQGIDFMTDHMDVTPSEKALDDLVSITNKNEEANNQWKDNILNAFNNNNELAAQTKELIARDLDQVLDYTVEKKNAEENLGKQFRSGASNSNIRLLENLMGKSINEVSDAELGAFIDTHRDTAEVKHILSTSESDIKQAADFATTARGKANWTMIDNAIASLGGGAPINSSNVDKINTALNAWISTQNLDEESADLLRKNYQSGIDTYNKYYELWSIANKIKQQAIERSLGTQATLDLKKNAVSKYGEELTGYFYTDRNDFEHGLEYNVSLGHDMYNPINVKKFAVGLDYVPYDNYPALLHKGERVLTAADARIDDLINDVAQTHNTDNNFNANNNYNNELTTTNSVLNSGFNTNAVNQELIIAALKTIISALTNGSGNSIPTESIFNALNQDKVALRTNNMAATASLHYQ
jgi:hypothetical protein